MCISRNVGWMTRCSGQKFAQLLKLLQRRDGLTQYENFTRTKSFIRFGIISVTLTPEMQVYVLIISCLVHTSGDASLLQALTGMFADGKNQVIMHRFGSNYPMTTPAGKIK